MPARGRDQRLATTAGGRGWRGTAGAATALDGGGCDDVGWLGRTGGAGRGTCTEDGKREMASGIELVYLPSEEKEIPGEQNTESVGSHFC